MKDTNEITMFQKLLIFSLVGIVPCLVYAVSYSLPITNYSIAPVEMFDYFNYIKVFAIKLIAFFMLLDMLADSLTSEKKNYVSLTFKERIKNIFKSRYAFLILILLSTTLAYIFSDIKPIARFGAIERFEGIWVHFSYVIIFIYCSRFFKMNKAFNVFSYAILFSTFIVGGIGTLQFFNINPFASSLMKSLTYKNFNLNIVMPGSFTTMYNTNTSGAYALLMMFILAIIFTLYKSKKIRAITVVDFIFIFITFINSYSEASYIAFIGGVGVFVLLSIIKFFKDNKKKEAIILTSICAFMLIITLMFAFVSEKGIILIENFIGPEAVFTDWKIENNNEVYFYNADDEYIKFITSNDGFQIFEMDKKIYEGDFVDGSFTPIETENFGTIELLDITESNGFNYINFNNYFLIKNANETELVQKESLMTLKYYKGIGFERHPNLFTNRGFIWSRSIPMLLKRPFGFGSDVFFMAFPNDDYVGKAFGNQPEGILIDKPHNIYLNMAINNGFLYVIGFIGIVFIILKERCLSLYKNNVGNRKAIAIMLYISGIMAYLINGLATDSIVVITTLFWVILSFNNTTFHVSDENIENNNSEN